MKNTSSEEFVIDINEDGTVTIEGKNFTDASCKLLSQQLEEDLGVVTKVTAKPELQRIASRSKTATKAVQR
jgi:hypothetical protein